LGIQFWNLTFKHFHVYDLGFNAIHIFFYDINIFLDGINIFVGRSNIYLDIFNISLDALNIYLYACVQEDYHALKICLDNLNFSFNNLYWCLNGFKFSVLLFNQF
jgi:hypothetical protein